MICIRISGADGTYMDTVASNLKVIAQFMGLDVAGAWVGELDGAYTASKVLIAAQASNSASLTTQSTSLGAGITTMGATMATNVAALTIL